MTIKWPDISRRQLYFLIPLAFLLLGFFGRSLYYYRGIYFAPDVPTSEVQPVAVLSQPRQAEPVVADGDSVVLIDNSHLNKFSDEEMTSFFGRITAAGGRVEVILPLHDDELEARLRGAAAFVVFANQEFYEQDELVLLENFVERGGRLLIAGDPTRITFVNAINSLSGHFGIIYEDDYIYNLVRNDGNYLNVILHEFAEDPITAGIDEIVVRAAHSIRAAEGSLVFGDADTYSSLRETPGDVVAAALTTEGNVLALPDLTFLTGPYNTFADNDLFMDNVVAWLLGGERQYEVLDFPHFFEESVEFVYTDSSFLQQTFSTASDLRTALQAAGLTPNQDDNLLPGEQALVVAQYAGLDSSIRQLLSDDGVRVNSVGNLINLQDIGEIDRSGSVLFHLHQEDNGAYQLIILVDSAEDLERGVSLLLEDEFERCVLRPQTALCSPDSLATPTPTATPTSTPSATNGEVEGQETEPAPATEEPTPSPTPTPTATASG